MKSPGRPKKKDLPKKPKFTQEQINTAVEVMKYSKIVRGWVLGELAAYGIDPKTKEGQAFIERETDMAARRAIQ